MENNLNRQSRIDLSAQCCTRSLWRINLRMMKLAIALFVFHISLLSSLSGAEKTEVDTRAATPLGLQAFTVNGRIQPHGLPTKYWFEYGTSTKLGSRTEVRELPPILGAFYHESWDDGPAGWQGGMSGQDLVHQTEGGDPGGFVRFTEPSGDDPNHVDGIGTLHLTSYFYPGTHPNSAGHLVNLGGGDPDFRDARVSISVRGNDFEPRGAEMLWWTQSENDISKQFTADWRRANWAYTGYTLTDALRSGNWERVTYRLTNDTHNWTYGGHNIAQNRPNYEYASIDYSLGHLTCDFFHLLAFVNPLNRPSGSIDIDEFTLAYRNYSLLIPSNGGRMIAFQEKSSNGPSRLIDGWRTGKENMWLSVSKPRQPQVLEFEFDHPVTIQKLLIHQHPQYPSQEVEVFISDDGMTWKSIIKKELPKDSPAGPNFSYIIEKGLDHSAKFAKFSILSGYQDDHWGLAEIELFGTGAKYGTDDDWYHVNVDIPDAQAGETYHYRLVTENESGRQEGEITTFDIPADDRPHTVTTEAKRIGKTAATLTGRLTPMGKSSRFYFEYGPTTKYGMQTEEQYGGVQITPRLVFAELTDLKPGNTYHYRLVGINETGTAYGADNTFETSAE